MVCLLAGSKVYMCVLMYANGLPIIKRVGQMIVFLAVGVGAKGQNLKLSLKLL